MMKSALFILFLVALFPLIPALAQSAPAESHGEAATATAIAPRLVAESAAKAAQEAALEAAQLAALKPSEPTRILPETQQDITLSFAPLVKKVAPAVVNIYTKRVVTRRVSPFAADPFFQQFFGDSFGFGGLTRKQVESSLGSGVIVDPSGLIVTNAHVIRDAEEITVILSDGREFATEKTLVDDPSDLALLRIDTGSEALPFVTLSSSESIEVGDLVLAIGNPFGVGQTVTSGIVSATARAALNISDFNFFIQTDAAINPGNSGGPLVAMDGGVIGINTAIFSRDGGSLGIGFAIPSEMVASVIAAEKSGQNRGHAVIRPWLGLSGQKITPDLAETLDLTQTQGVLIADLHRASPALKAGLRAGDVITAINDRPVREPYEMRFRMAMLPLGEEADFQILRRGQTHNFKVAAIAPPNDPPRNDRLLTGNTPFSGATIVNINPAVGVQLGIPADNGVAVLDIDRRGNAARFLSPGDIIISINGRAVVDVDNLVKMLETNSGAHGWNILLSRAGRRHQIVVR